MFQCLINPMVLIQVQGKSLKTQDCAVYAQKPRMMTSYTVVTPWFHQCDANGPNASQSIVSTNFQKFTGTNPFDSDDSRLFSTVPITSTKACRWRPKSSLIPHRTCPPSKSDL